MTISIFQCSKCNRTTEFNISNLSISFTNKCIITDGCMGNLTRVGQRLPGINGRPTPIDENLEDYLPKSRLYKHEQLVSASKWDITHDMDTNPIVYVYSSSVNSSGKRGYEQLDSDLYYVNIIDSKNITIEFDDKYLGVAHIIARSTTNIKTTPDAYIEQFNQVSSNNILTIATPIIPNDGEVVVVKTSFIHPTSSEQITKDVTFTAHRYDNKIALFNSPWRDVELITWNFKTYRVRSIRLNTLMSNIGASDGVPIFFPNDDFIILTSSSPYETIVDINPMIIQSKSLLGDIYNNRISNNEYLVEGKLLYMYPPGVKVAKLITE